MRSKTVGTVERERERERESYILNNKSAVLFTILAHKKLNNKQEKSISRDRKFFYCFCDMQKQ